MTAQLTLAEAARVARAAEDDVREALNSGDLRNLTPRAVEQWARARVAGVVTRAGTP